MANSKTRITGAKTFHSIEELERANLAVASPDNPIHQKSTAIAEVAEIFSHVLDSKTPFFHRDKNGVPLSDDIYTVRKKMIEREGGDDTGLKTISENGIIEVAGANDAEYKISYSVELMINGVAQVTAGGAMGLIIYFRGSNASRVASRCGGEGRVLACLNGLYVLMDLGVQPHKQTKNWIANGGQRQLCFDGIQSAINNHAEGKYDGLYNELNDRIITSVELHDTIMKAKNLKVISSQDIGKVYDIYNDTTSVWFSDDRPSAWRLLNAFTRHAETCGSLVKRDEILSRVQFPLADAGLCKLPEGFHKASARTFCDVGNTTYHAGIAQ